MILKIIYHYYQGKKIEKLVANLHDKKGYVIHTKSLKQALNHGLRF